MSKSNEDFNVKYIGNGMQIYSRVRNGIVFCSLEINPVLFHEDGSDVFETILKATRDIKENAP